MQNLFLSQHSYILTLILTSLTAFSLHMLSLSLRRTRTNSGPSSKGFHQMCEYKESFNLLSSIFLKIRSTMVSRLMASSKTNGRKPKTKCKRKNRVCTKKKGLITERFWTEEREMKPCPQCRGSSTSVEMTAYMAATLVMLGREKEALPIIKWLGKQRNSQGGFLSTQDTVVALQAISLYSQKVSGIPMKMTVKVMRGRKGRPFKKFTLNEANKLLLQVGKKAH